MRPIGGADREQHEDADDRARHRCRGRKSATGRISHAATIGARPKVDSSDRSMPPMMMIRLSPTTTTPSAEICCPTPARFEVVRNAGLTSEPTIRSTTSTGKSAAPRTNATAARRRLRRSNGAPSSAVSRGLRFADVGHRLSPDGHEALGGCDQLLVVVRAAR